MLPDGDAKCVELMGAGLVQGHVNEEEHNHG